MAYAHTNSKGNTYYLHSNGRMFFFSKEIKDNALDAVPEGYNVAEMKTGMLVLKKNKPAEAPAPAAPVPMAPASEAPAPMAPATETPAPETPAPMAPASEEPAPDKPSEGGM